MISTESVAGMKMIVRRRLWPRMPEASSTAKSSPSVFCTTMWMVKNTIVFRRAFRNRSRQIGSVKRST